MWVREQLESRFNWLQFDLVHTYGAIDSVIRDKFRMRRKSILKCVSRKVSVKLSFAPFPALTV